MPNVIISYYKEKKEIKNTISGIVNRTSLVFIKNDRFLSLQKKIQMTLKIWNTARMNYTRGCKHVENNETKSYQDLKIYKLAFDKTYNTTCATSEDSDQPGHPPSLIGVVAVREMDSYGPKLSSRGPRKLWSDWADTQADLSLLWAHMPFCWLCRALAQMIVPKKCHKGTPKESDEECTMTRQWHICNNRHTSKELPTPFKVRGANVSDYQTLLHQCSFSQIMGLPNV